jgi:hypothetical protein
MVPDYYAMLGVDSGADRKAIDAALARQQPLWSSGTRNPKNKHTYQSYLDQIPALRQALLGDPTARAAYDAELAAARRAERDGKLDELQRLVRLRAAKGGLSVSDRTLLRDEAGKLGLTADELDRLVQAIPPRPEPPPELDEPDPPVDALDPVTRRQIRVALEHLRRRDLYDALGLARDAPASEIAARADAERQRWMQKAQVTAEKTAWLEVVSLAQSHLTQPAARARYDRTLGLEAEESLVRSIEFTLKGLTGLDPGTREVLAEQAAALGIDPARADRLLTRACRSLGVSRETGAPVGPVSAPPRLLRCRTCYGVTEFGRVSGGKGTPECRHCRASLHWKCPVCQRSRWVDEPRCACGFRVELVEPLVRHFEAAQHAFRVRDYGGALAHLQRVQEFAPHHVGARKGVARVQERLAEIDRARGAWEAAFAAGRLVAARAALSAWAKLVEPGDAGLKAARGALAVKLAEARNLLAKAQALETRDPKAARAAYRRCLAVGADLPEVAAGLQHCPPDPPTDLRAQFIDGRVRLRWIPPAPDGLGSLSYVVLRKAETPFRHPRDGVKIAEVAGTEYVDEQVKDGESVSYAVLSQRGRVQSLAAVTLGPIFLFGDVIDLRVEVRSREVDLYWTSPANAQHVLVVRKLGTPPANPKDGERVEAMRDRALDRGLTDDRVYHYGIFALYRYHDGRLVPSPGVFASAEPSQPIPPLAAPRLSQGRPGEVRLDWDRPTRGKVRILRSLKPIAHAPGDRLAVSQADGLAGEWLDTPAPDHAIDPSPPAFGVCHYTPFTAWAGGLTVGQSASYSCVPDPSDLRVTRVGGAGRVHLRWRWSPQGTESLVVAKAGSPPSGPEDPEAHATTVHEGEYSRQGFFTTDLPAGSSGPWHVAVYAVAGTDGARIYSPGLEPTARTVVPGPHPEVTVSYVFRRPKFPGRPWSLTFRTEPAGAAIPPTALVAHPRTVPLTVDDGQIVEQFPAAHDGTTFPIQARVDLSTHRARIFADPRLDPDSVPPIRLRHPETAATRV